VVRDLLTAQPGFTISGWTESYAAKTFSPRVLSLLRDGLRS
jgi:hypothetical protein